MKVTVEHFKGSEIIRDSWYYVQKIEADPVQVHLIQEGQITALPAAQILKMQVESDPDILMF